MTHVPDCDKTPRRGKMIALCGEEVSIRKAVTDFPSCPGCAPHCTEAADVLALIRTITEWSDLMLERWCFIRAQKALLRRRWRK